MTTSNTPSAAVILMVLAGLVALVAVAVKFLRRSDPRQRAFTELLDAADALESRLRTARSEIEAITGVEDEAVRTALQEMLRQRLWLQQHGATASLQQLKDMRASMDAARARIDQQLGEVERARAASI